LNLAHNQIKTLPPEIGALYNLQSLFIENNHFVAFPTSLRDLVKLKEFALDWFKYLNPPLP
jgi:Leucine-rich repeat (LRR) protein